ncbi:MAG: hypothetical protein GJ676_20410 [Rhodobacteraceae bacterium]|nr:hypothetical protein [Paracoccaceae bacterium]
MPHAELKYSSDLAFDPVPMLAEIEATILEHDAGAGTCKGRAYPTDLYHHTHIIVSISLLPKAHRDAAFLKALSDDLEARIKTHLTQDCAFSLDLAFSGASYVTNMHHAARK